MASHQHIREFLGAIVLNITRAERGEGAPTGPWRPLAAERAADRADTTF